MPQLIKPTIVKVVPKEGELEITLHIHITVDGQVQATATNVEHVSVKVDESTPEEDSRHYIPNFGSGFKVNFGKKEES
jgi:hypothetical protein